MITSNSRFLVMGLTGLVLRDLVNTITDWSPDLQPHTAMDESEAVEQVQKLKGWHCAFLNLGPDRFIASELSHLLAQADVKVVLLGNDAEDAAQDSLHPVLVRPFTTDDIMEVLQSKQ